MGTLLAAKVRQMVLFLGHRYFLLQLVVPDVIVRLRRMFPTVRIRPTVPVGDELLDSNGASAVKRNTANSVTLFSTMCLRIPRICAINLAVAGTMVIRFMFQSLFPK